MGILLSKFRFDFNAIQTLISRLHGDLFHITLWWPVPIATKIKVLLAPKIFFRLNEISYKL